MNPRKNVRDRTGAEGGMHPSRLGNVTPEGSIPAADWRTMSANREYFSRMSRSNARQTVGTHATVNDREA